MKTLVRCVIFFGCIFPTIDLIAQQIDCGTKASPTITKTQAAPYGDPSNLVMPTTVKTIHLAIHVVRTSTQPGISLQNIDLSLSQLNTAYSNSFLRFIKFSIDYIESDTYYQIEDSNELLQLFGIYNNPNAINVYFIGGTSENWAGNALTIPSYSVAIVNDYATIWNVLAHEIGHCFNLYHPHETIFGYEKVTRIVGDDGSCPPNCTEAGDLLCDTPADPNLIDKVNSNCEYDPPYPPSPPRDECNQFYVPDTRNIMAYVKECGEHFSNQQIGRMHEAIENRMSNLLTGTSITFQNKIGTSVISGTSLGVNNIIVNSNETVKLFSGTTYSVKTNHERLQGNNKNNNWDESLNQFRLKENYPVGTVPTTRRANFVGVTPVTLSTLIDGFAKSISIRDPWYVADANGSQPNSFFAYQTPVKPPGIYNATASDSGVFLGIDYDYPVNPFYEIEAPTSIDGKSTYMLSNWSITQGSALFETPSMHRTKIRFDQSNTSVTSNLKGQLMSNYNYNFTNSGQRKIVRTSDGTLHIFYQSLDKIWYERSTNGGTTWQTTTSLTSSNGKLPAACVYGNNIILVYQENNGGNAQIRVKNYLYSGGNLTEQATAIIATSVANTYPTNPTVSSTSGGLLAVVWQENRIYYKTYNVTSSTLTAYSGAGNSGYFGNSNSVTPAVVASGPAGQSGITNLFHIAYEQKAATYSNVMYKQLLVQTGGITSGTLSILSTGSGYTWNYLPSIIVLNDDIARLSWNGQRLNPYDPDIQENVSIFKAADYYYFWSFGNLVTSTQLNRSNVGYLIAWSQAGTTIYNKDNTILNSPTIRTMSNVSGGTVQVSEGLSSNSFYVAGLNINQTPYRFSVGLAQYGFAKSQSNGIANGRTGVIAQDDAQFYFVLGDVMVNGEPIAFVEFPDTISVFNAANLNNVLTTKPFAISNSSQLFFSVQYGTTDSTSAINLLGSNGSVSYLVELIDAQTKEVIGSYDNIVFNALNPTQYDNLGYQVNVDGIGNRTVQLRLVVSHNGLDPVYNVTDRQSTEATILGKQERKAEKISYRGTLGANEFGLIQNFPNPFNPSTTISYTLPKAEYVMLKVYDVLGKEVATLVNSYKESGRFSVEFDASNLSSGIYIYKLTSDTFSEVKKMMLVK